MKIDFDSIDDTEGYSPPPVGRYFVESLECEELIGKTSGNAYFKLKLVIIDGDHENKIINDSLFFSSQKAEEHSKFAMKRMGVETEGDRDVEPEELIGFKYQVDVIHEKYDDNGTEKTACKVGFYGYHYFNEDEDGNKIEDEDDEGKSETKKTSSSKKSTTKKATKPVNKTEVSNDDDIEDLDL